MALIKFKSFKYYHLYLKLKSFCQLRTLFSINGCMPAEFTKVVKRDIEVQWKDKINSAYPSSKDAEKFYLLSMFPYPSGNLHMGHVRVYTISDSIARFLRMNGKKVIHPIGWDAFGLPAENAAIEKNIHPFEWTHSNINTMKKQLQDFNLSFDWNLELSTCDPSYYKWTQYLFLLMYEKGLAYKKKSLVNWDPVDHTVLADEQVDENGISWRSGCKVEKKRLSQWFLSTSAFAKSLYDGLSDPSLVEWRDAIKIQKHWIGKPDGFIIHFNICNDGKILNDTLAVWTDVPELIYGASFIGISPNNHFNDSEYESDPDKKENKLKISAVHPFTGDELPVYVSENLDHSSATDSYLGISSVTNEKNSDFISKYAIKAPQVIDISSQCLINSGEFSGMDRQTAKEKIIEKLRQCNVKVYLTSNKLRDWLISRQRYWGTPIPIINCPKCKTVPVPLSDLPVTLPQLKEFSGKGCSLSSVTEWINVKCPNCGRPATRETDTMDTFVDSSWYFLRYLDVHNESEAYNIEKVNANMPVDLYIGGKEHAGLHMFYARFFCHFLHSVNKLKYSEPFIQLLMQGMVMGKSYRVKGSGRYIRKEDVDFTGKYPVEKTSGTAVIEDWEKMSKSKYNGVDPQEVIEEHGIDTTRLFILGNVAPQSPRKWNDELFSGIQNFQWRIWLTLTDFIQQRETESEIGLSLDEIQQYEIKLSDARNYYIKGITHNFINTRQLSVAISKLQGLTGELRRIPKTLAKTNAFEETLGVLIIMLAPLAPHFASELWVAFCSAAKNKKSHYYNTDKPVLHQKWPQFDENCEMQINIKLNGDECDVIRMPRPDLLKLSKEETIQLALSSNKVVESLEGIKIKNTHCRLWPNYDSEVNITFVPMGKKAKKAHKLQKAKAANT